VPQPPHAIDFVRFVVFDFNGTLSDDEPILCGIYRELFAERGRKLSERDYYEELAGLSDEAIARALLGDDDDAVESFVAERIRRYRELVSDGSTIGARELAAVGYAAERVPVAIVSGAARAELEPLLEASGLGRLVRAVVAGDEVAHGKPHPEGYIEALRLLGGPPPQTAVAFEDTEAGVASAASAGLRVVGVTRTLGAARLAAADELVERVDTTVVRRLLG